MSDKNNDKKEFVDDFKQKILEEYDRLGLDDKFNFICGHTVKCFTACCGDVNIFLTPYDVIRMRRRLGLSSQEFLEKYTVNPFTKTQKLPSVLMRLRDDNKRCHFVNEQGCTIYEDRPWACRMYPIGKASPMDVTSGTGSEEEFFFLMAEDECLGVNGEGGKEFTIREWIENQGIAEYDEMGDLFKKVALHPLLEDIDLTPQKMEMFYLAFYKMEEFADFVSNDRFRATYDIPEGILNGILADEVELYKFAVKWLLFGLFNEPAIKIRDEVLKAKKKAMGLDGEEETEK